ncbi:hypothetical protein [Georgenia deserti]|uniref:DUF2238 domain-containing protein n=1 Tax=Georgenia deserti TaxID=2093781 RepID=A0ABW4L4Z7_9MICO
MSTAAARSPRAVVAADVGVTVLLAALVVGVVIDQDGFYLRGKAGELRAATYPLLAGAVPAAWAMWWRDRPFPWLADLLVTTVCAADLLGNRLNLYDTVAWFDDVMHLVNTGLLAAALVLLTRWPARALLPVLERAVAFGASAAIVWEVAEYFAFLAASPDAVTVYPDTLSDLGYGLAGSAAAAVALTLLWRGGRLRWVVPMALPRTGRTVRYSDEQHGPDALVTDRPG